MTFTNALAKRFKREFFATLPTDPGIYLMRDRKGSLLYVGKAKNLRARLISYRYARRGTVGENIVELLECVRHIDVEVFSSIDRATVREREVIRAVLPPHNVADAWSEDYLFIGVRGPRQGQLHFRLTDCEAELEGFERHGCYSHRRLTKQAYAALLRVLFASVAPRRDRFSIPMNLCRSSPVYNYSLAIAQGARRWRNLISNFLNGHDSQLLTELVKALLNNPTLPAYMHPGLQRDLETLKKFAELGSSAAGFRTQQALREAIRQSISQRPMAPSRRATSREINSRTRRKRAA